jgi:hypothetical protein
MTNAAPQSPSSTRSLAVVRLSGGGSMRLAWAGGRLELQVLRAKDGGLAWADAVPAEQIPALVDAMHAASAEATWQAARTAATTR